MDWYHYYIYENVDKRTKDWFLVGSPLPMLGIIACYVALVYYVVPRVMRNREPFQLKTFMGFYNLFQVAYCVFLIWRLVDAGWRLDYFYRCYETDYSNNPRAVHMAETMWYLLMIKLFELIETVLFVLRKKHNQVTTLHVYHHISTFFIAWIFVKYIGGSMLTFSIVANCVVHILMYSYYFMSAYDVPLFKLLVAKYKKYITSIQLIQFVMMTINNLLGLRPSCNTSKPFLAMYIPNVLILAFLFYDFYRKSYTRRTAQAMTHRKKLSDRQ